MQTIKRLALCALSCLLFAGFAVADDEEQLKMQDVPAAVKKAVKSWIRANAKGSKIIEIEAETEDGRKVYEFEIATKDGKEIELELDKNGKVLEVEREDDDDDEDEDEDEDDEKASPESPLRS